MIETLVRTSPPPFYITGGTMPRNALSYIERDADRELYEGLRAGQFCYVLTSRQMGKSSLMVRTAARLREEGCAVAVLDLTAVGQNLNAEQWYDGLLNLLARAFDLDDELEEFWLQNRRLGPLQRWMQCLHDVVMARIPGRIVLFLEEIDAVRSLPFSADEFFAAIRECYNRRTDDPDYHRLTFCLLGVATPSDLIQDTRTTPFNIGRRITLTDFRRDEAALFAEGFQAEGVRLPPGETSFVSQALDRALYWTGGHPYLTQRLCGAVVEHLRNAPHELQSAADIVDQLCAEIFLSPSAREREDNLIFVRERLLRSEADLASLLILYRQVCEGLSVKDDETNPLVSVLRLSGVTRTNNQRLVVRNPIYAQVFDRAWITQNMPDGELRRQQAAYRRGVLRTAALAGGILLIMATLVGFAMLQARDATTARADALRNLTSANQEKEKAKVLTRSVQNANQQLEAALDQSRASLALAEERREQAVSATHMASEAEANARHEATRASQAARTAEVASVRAKEEAETTRQTLYASQVAQAQATYDAGLAPQARHLLDALRPKEGQKDLRGFEWRYLWQQSADASRQTFHDSDLSVTALAISPNGKYLATGNGSSVLLRNLKTGAVAATLGGLYGPVRCLAFSPGGRLLGMGSGTVAVLRDLSTERDVLTLDGGADISGLTFSPDGELLAIATATEIRIQQVQSKQQVARLATGAPCHRLVFTPDGGRLFVARNDGVVQVWRPVTAQALESFRADSNDIEALTLSANSKLLATSTQTGKIKLWDINESSPVKNGDRKPLATWDGHAGRVLALAFSPDGKTLATAGFDGVLRLWDVATRTLLRSLLGHPAAIENIAFTPDGATIATGGRGGLVKLWSADQQATQTVVHLPDQNNNQLSPDSSRVISFRPDGVILLSDLLTGKTSRLPGTLQGTPFATAFTSDSQAIYRRIIRNGDATTGKDGISPNSYRERLVRTERDGSTRTLGTLPENYAADYITPGDTEAVAHYRQGKNVPVAIIALPSGHITSTASVRAPIRYNLLSRQGGCLFMRGDDGIALLWARKMGIRRLAHIPDDAVPMAFSPNDRYLALRRATEVLVLDTATGTIRFALRGHTDTVDNVRWSWDGKYLATCGADRTIRIWDAEKGALSSLLQGHPGRVICVAFSHDQRTLASFGDEGTVRLWNLATRQEVARFAAGAAGTMALDFTEGDKALVLTNFSEATVRVWRAPTFHETDNERIRPTLGTATNTPSPRPTPSLTDKLTPNLIPYQGRSVAWTGLFVDTSEGAKATTVNESDGATRVDIARPVTDAFQIAIGVNDFPVEGEMNYELRFRARADRERPIGFRLESRQPEYTAYLRQSVALTRSWQTYRFTAVTPGGLKQRTALLNLGLGQVAGSVWITDVSLRQIGARSPHKETSVARNVLLNSKGGINWNLSQDASGSAPAVWNSEGRGVERLTIRPIGKQEGRVHLDTGPLDLAPGRSYLLTFQARADAPRRLPVSVHNYQAPRDAIGPERVLDITPKWRMFRLPFRAGANAVRKGGCLTFNVGLGIGTLWIADVILTPLEEGIAPTMVDLFPQRGRNNGWNLECDSNTGASGDMTDLTDGAMRFTVKATGWEEWNVRTVVPLPTLRPNSHYVLSFDARADKSRSITVRMQHDRANWEELGLFKKPQLTNNWQEFRWEFVTPPTTEAGHGSLVLGMSQTTGTIDLRNVHLIAFNDPTPMMSVQVHEPLETVSGRDVMPKSVRNVIAKIPWEFYCDEKSGAAATRRQESDGTTRVDITANRAPAGDDLGITLSRSPLTLQPGIRYTLRFRARADRKRVIRALTHTSLGNFSYVPLDAGKTFALTTEWKRFTYSFIPARSPNPGNDALLVVLGQTTGTVWIADAQLAEGDDSEE